MIDAHAHPGTVQERRMRERLGIATLLCGTDPASAAEALEYAAGSAVYTPCCALHPWKAADFPPEAMLPFLDQCPVVGETGLDSVWCDIPMTAQTEVFLWHLDYAQRTGKPVVLHTKGREREAAQILRRYSMEDCLQGESILLKIEQDENGDDIYATIEDENEYQRVFQRCLEVMEEQDGESDGDENDDDTDSE